MRLSRPALIVVTLLWVLLVLYPDPLLLGRSVGNVIDPSIDAEAARALAAKLPDDPELIEAYVLNHQVPYAYDWQSAGVPWYFPTGAEALTAGAGDCESRAMALASILRAKGIPCELRMSFSHIWVAYEGKRPTAIENDDLELAGRRDGRLFVQAPPSFNLSREIADQFAIMWDPAPLWRGLALLVGVALLPLTNVIVAALVNGRRGAAGRSGRPQMAADGARTIASPTP